MAVEHTGEDLLQIRELSVTYSFRNGRRVHALNRLSLQVRSGEILAILGESGCGKSTLARALSRLLPAHATYESGEILFRDRDVLKLAESRLRAIRGKEISLIPQDPALSLNPVMKVGTQISEVLRAHMDLSRTERKVRVKELLRQVGFPEPAGIYDSYPHQLSGGQRQRIVIAQAVACQPGLLVADEPTSKLDACLQSEVLERLCQMRDRYGTTVVVISHDPALAAAFADRVAVMYAGRVVEVGLTSQIFRHPLHPYTRALVQLANVSPINHTGVGHRFPMIPGEPPDPYFAHVGCAFESRCSERFDLCSHTDPREVSPEPSRSVTCFQHDR
jgi:oligopeptide/dipeptide ABC transporter ATP-binding protein